MRADPAMQTGHALVCHAYGDPPQVELERPTDLPRPGPGEVLLEVDHAAVNFTDWLMMQGRYQDRPEPPFVPGLDAAGRIAGLGPGVEGWQLGERVVLSGVPGAYARHRIAQAERLVRLPDGLASDAAVAAINSHLTAYHGLLDRAGLRAGERVLVLGASGAVGRASVQVARHVGALVHTLRRTQGTATATATASGDEGGAWQVLGPSETILAEGAVLKTLLREVFGREGIDVVVDPIGGDATEAAVRNLAWRGRLLVIGFAAGDIPTIPLNLLLLRGATVSGVYCGGLLLREEPAFVRQLGEMFAWMAAGVLEAPRIELAGPERFAEVWSRFSQLPRGHKWVIDFRESS